MFGGRIMDTFDIADSQRVADIGLLMAGISPDDEPAADSVKQAGQDEAE